MTGGPSGPPVSRPRGDGVVGKSRNAVGRISYGRHMTSRKLPAALAVTTLLLAACGGSDGDAGSGDSPFGGGGDDLDIGDQILQDSGIDLDDLDLGDIEFDENGELDLDSLGLDEIADAADDAVEGFANGSGNATITFDGVSYPVADATCFVYGNDMNLDGPGTTADGQPFWASVDYTVNDRQEMLDSGVFDEAFLDQMFGGKDQAVDLSVEVEVGKTERFGSAPEGMPEFSADILLDEPFFGEFDYQRDGSTITGSGETMDGTGEMIPFEFTATCS
ncbi:hypothetical protein YM304_08180 [Ilumatobacter coccineus YM16-304]|uniref:Uncharacterized protein n=2 Tax=Ilumatobacter coccineus TaxID=467094 RepID=A0A6C7E4K2_ILUCY|nr:hypothetical protein YM304_08180 [Ilumatobacter coccineus YM16-304]